MKNEAFEKLICEFGFDDFAVKISGSGGFTVVCIKAVEIFDDGAFECSIVPFYAMSQRGRDGFLGLLGNINSIGFFAEPVEKGASLKQLAAELGIGFIGLNTLCISEKYGSDFFICAFETDFPLEETNRRQRGEGGCKNCGRCVKACPTDAIDGCGGFSRKKCLRNYMLSGQIVPESFREKMGKQLLGCKICQDACPHNRTREVVSAPENMQELTKLIYLLDGETDPWHRQRQELFGTNYMRRERMCAQALIVAGNTKRRDLLCVIDGLAESDNPAIAQHAKWAAEKIRRSC